jgi:hypothetical protein
MDDSSRFGWDEDAEARPWADWPRCPRCGTRRETACPDCALPGDDFALAELDPAADFGESQPAPSDGPHTPTAAWAHAQDCTATPRQASGPNQTSVPPDDQGPPASDAGPDLLLVCPICDEAFPPRFFRRCRKCGHDFGSGPEFDANEKPTTNFRIIITLLAVLAVIAGIGCYLLFLFGE